MSAVPYTVGSLREALEAFDDDMVVMVPGEDDLMWEHLCKLREEDLDLYDENEDGEPSERRCVILEGE